MKATTTLAGLSLLLAGCVTPPVVDTPTCTPPAVVRINHAAGSLSADPDLITIELGCSVTLQIVPPVDPGRARTKQARTGNRWLNQRNMARDEIVLTPSPRTELNTEIKYSVEIEGVGKLDPRIVVQQ